MTILTVIENNGPLTEIITGVVTGLILFIWRKIEKGALERKHKRQLKKALLQDPPVDAAEQLANMDKEDEALNDSVSKSIKPIIKNLFKKK